MDFNSILGVWMTDTRFPMQRLEHEERMKRRTLEVCVFEQVLLGKPEVKSP